MRYVVYRILYGEDFIEESIRSIYEYVDKIFIFWTNQALGGATECVYKGETIIFPDKFDGVIAKLRHMQEVGWSKIILREDYVENNLGQFTHLCNDLILPHYPKPDTILFMEPDHVFSHYQLDDAFEEFSSSGKRHASTSMVELWKTPFYRIESSHRHHHLGAVFWDMRNHKRVPATQRHANTEAPGNTPRLKALIHNFGFCVSERSMYWKHMTALGFSQIIQDSPPGEDWYEKKWKAWDFETNNSDLEICARFAHYIPRAVPYDTTQLPYEIKFKYNIEEGV